MVPLARTCLAARPLHELHQPPDEDGRGGLRRVGLVVRIARRRVRVEPGPARRIAAAQRAGRRARVVLARVGGERKDRTRRVPIGVGRDRGRVIAEILTS